MLFEPWRARARSTSPTSTWVAVCPSIFIGGDDYPVALCTRITDLRPVDFLLDPEAGSPRAPIELTAGNLFGGVYGYLDDNDRLVLVDGTSDLVRIGHRRGEQGWSLEIDERVPLAASILPGDTVTSVSPDYHGDVWLATGGGTIGAVDTAGGWVNVRALPAGERVSNSISTAPEGNGGGYRPRGQSRRPGTRWTAPRALAPAHGRGPARKPGQLSWGTGSTPTFFGPTNGSDCNVVWESTVRSAAVPKLSTADGTITTVTRQAAAAGSTSEPDMLSYAVISAPTGELLTEQNLGAMGADPLQLAGTIGPGRGLFQGTVGAILRISVGPES